MYDIDFSFIFQNENIARGGNGVTARTTGQRPLDARPRKIRVGRDSGQNFWDAELNKNIGLSSILRENRGLFHVIGKPFIN